MKQRILVFILSAWLLLGIAPSLAQDLSTNTPEGTLVATEPAATVEPTPPVVEQPPTSPDSDLLDLVQAALPWLGAIAIVALLTVGILGREALVRLGKSTPAYVREPVISGLETGLASLEGYTKTTETTIDDAAVAEFKKFFQGLIEEIRAEEKAKVASAGWTPPS